MSDPSTLQASSPASVAFSNDAFALLEAALVDAIVVLAADGTVGYASDRLCRMLGYDAGAMKGQRLADLVHPDDRSVLPEGPWWRLDPADREFRMREAGGGYRWMSAATSASNADGERRQALADALGGGSLILLRDTAQGDIVRDRVDLYRHALNSVNNLVVLSDPRMEDNPIVFVNDNFLDITGYQRADVLGQNCRFLQFRADGTRDDQPEEREELQSALDEARATGVLLRNYRKDGTLFYNQLYINPIRAESGELVGFVGVQNDATELVESRQDATQRDQLLTAFFESAPFAMGVLELREDGRMRHLAGNAVARDLYSVEEDAPVTELFADEAGFTPEEERRWRRALETCRATGEPVRFSTLFPWGSEQEAPDARHLDIVVNVADAERLFFSYVAENVTERRSVERERKMLQQAVASSPEGILITDGQLEEPGPRIAYANQAFEKMSGYRFDEIEGKTPRLFQGPKTDQEVLGRLRQHLRAGRPFTGETVNYRKDGTEYIVNWDIAPIYDANGDISHWTSTLRDVTERRRLEREVLEVSAREQERIARDLHDGLGQTIAAASMLSSTVAEDLSDGDHPSAGTADRIHAMLRDAVRQTRALAHGLHPANLRKEGLIQALAHLADSASGAYGVDCRFECEEPVLLTGHDRVLHLYRIVQEAIVNAVRHGEAQNIVVSLEPSAATDGTGVPAGHVALRIQDDGVGISQDSLSSTDGIGLRSMRYRAEQLQGALTICEADGGGTLVEVVFDPKAVIRPAF